MRRRAFPKFTDFRGGSLFHRLFGQRKTRPKIGKRTFVDPSAQFLGCEKIKIGSRSILSEGCWLNVNDRSGEQLRIVIGDHCFISRRVFMSSGYQIFIGDYCLIGNETCFLGADHDFSDPFVPYLTAPAVNGESIVLGPNCWLGTACTVLKGVSIGHGCVVGARSLVTKSIPPLSIALGSPARVIKRFRLSEKSWVPIAEWTDKDEAEIPSEKEYLARIHENYRWVSMPYIVGGGWFGNL